MLDKPLADGEFRARVSYLLERLKTTRPDSTIVVITPFMSKQDLVGKRGPKDLHSLEDFRKILREEVIARPDSANLRLLEGCEILNRADGLSADLCHPSDFGHALMAANFTTLLAR